MRKCVDLSGMAWDARSHESIRGEWHRGLLILRVDEVRVGPVSTIEEKNI